MKVHKNSVNLTFEEFYSLLGAFGSFKDILLKDGDVYYSTEDLTCIDADIFDVCSNIYNNFYSK